jgi:signal transduction histidine kinase
MLSEAQVAALFPAYIAVHTDLTIRSMGPELQHRAPWIALGDKLLQVFASAELTSPTDLEKLAVRQSVFAVSARANQILLRGTAVSIENGFLLALSFDPNRRKLGPEGATIADHPPGDPILEALLLAGIHHGLIEDTQKIATDLLIERNRVQDVSRRISKLAGLLAHDFNNLLSIIVLNGQRLIRMGAMDQRQRDCVTVILESTGKCTDLTAGLITLSGQKLNSPLPFELDAALRSCEAMFRSICADDVELKLELAAGLSEINVARNGLISAVGNLIMNARAAMNSKGAIRLVTSLDCDDAEAKAVRKAGTAVVMVAVTDDGPGMPKAVQHRIFEKFYTTNETASGMGLPFVYDFVTQMKGRIRIFSAEGTGTEVRMYLPLFERDGDAVEAGRIPHRRPRVLLVDDEHHAVDGLTEILEDEGFTVQAALSAEAAIRIAQETPPDLLLTDIVMRGMDGIKLAKWVERELPGVPIILMSGFAPDQSRIAPDWKFLSKPLDPALLSAMLNSALAAAK